MHFKKIRKDLLTAMTDIQKISMLIVVWKNG